MRADAPLFHSAAAAVAWAYETVSRVPVKSCAVYAMRGPRHPSRLGLSPDEAHAQAAMILSLVERTLHPMELAYARARFGRAPESLQVLVEVVMRAQGTGVHSRDVATLALLMYLGEPVGLRTLRAELRQRMTAAIEYRKRAYDALDKLHRRTIGRLDEALREAGVVGVA